MWWYTEVIYPTDLWRCRPRKSNWTPTWRRQLGRPPLILVPSTIKHVTSIHYAVMVHSKSQASPISISTPPPFAEGFTTVAMLSYSNLEKSADGYFSAMEPQEAESFKINSRVVTISVSNRNTSRLDQPVKLTFNHLEQVANILSNIAALWSNVSPLKKRGRKWWRVGRKELFLSFCYCTVNMDHTLQVTDQGVFSVEIKLKL